MTVIAPQQIEKIQRRAFNRAPAPPGECITIEFCATQHSQCLSTNSYVLGNRWQGILHDLSAGGLGVVVPESEMPDINEGDQFEACFTPLPNQELMLIQARFRHASDISESNMVMLGFQIVGMEMSEEGRNMLRRISRIVNVFQRMKKMSVQTANNE
jgi:c-di-GMP-binding flagellar brake protein YcgR